MNKYPEHEILLKNGMRCILRNLMPDDAEEMNLLMKQIYSETDYLMRYPEETEQDSRNTRTFLRKNNADPRSINIGAFVNDRLIGVTQITGVGDHIKTRHRSTLAIAILNQYSHIGLGRALVQEDIRMAREFGYEQIELGVYAENAAAGHLYESCGFVQWGITPNAFKLKDGTCRDEVEMGLILNCKDS
ncbi:MAG: GNAT family N-acetyltransferase [Erysipelotrichia bacterium]|nr:GNAT family N-acetyltransferase [Erysipelotrichia bacterium]